jgi:hypothetical protein
MAEPDSIRATAREGHYLDLSPYLTNPDMEYITMAIGRMPVTVVKTNMIALAAKYPTVAADLAAVGLTARQEDAYRDAVIRVVFTHLAGKLAGPIRTGSVLEKNLAFLAAQPKAFDAIAHTGMWTTQ